MRPPIQIGRASAERAGLDGVVQTRVLGPRNASCVGSVFRGCDGRGEFHSRVPPRWSNREFCPTGQDPLRFSGCTARWRIVSAHTSRDR